MKLISKPENRAGNAAGLVGGRFANRPKSGRFSKRPYDKNLSGGYLGTVSDACPTNLCPGSVCGPDVGIGHDFRRTC